MSRPFTAELAGKRLELRKESIQKITRVAVLWSSQGENSAQYRKESQIAAAKLGLQIYSIDVNSADKFEEACKEAIRARSGAVSVNRRLP